MRALIMALSFGLIFTVTSTADAASYCIQLGGGNDIELDVNGADITGETIGSPYWWVGKYVSGNAYMSLGYSDAPTRPILHVWNVGSKTGVGRANDEGTFSTWTYDWNFCPAPNGDGGTIIIEDPGFNVLLGPDMGDVSVD